MHIRMQSLHPVPHSHRFLKTMKGQLSSVHCDSDKCEQREERYSAMSPHILHKCHILKTQFNLWTHFKLNPQFILKSIHNSNTKGTIHSEDMVFKLKVKHTAALLVFIHLQFLAEEPASQWKQASL